MRAVTLPRDEMSSDHPVPSPLAPAAAGALTPAGSPAEDGPLADRRADSPAGAPHYAHVAAHDALHQVLTWHKEQQLADREHDLTRIQQAIVTSELEEFISRASSHAAAKAIDAYEQAKRIPPPTGRCGCGWALVDVVDKHSGKCIHCRIKAELAARRAGGQR